MSTNISWLSVDQSPVDAQAWGDFLGALRDKMSSSWSRAESAYLSLKKVREQLGLPFIDDLTGGEGGSAASHGAWTSDLEKQAQNLHAISVLSVNALNDAITGKREVFYNDKGDLAIRSLDTDLILLDMNAQGVPVLVQGPAAANPGQQTDVAAPIGVGVPALVWIATAGVSVLALPAYFIADAAINALTDVAEQKTARTLGERAFDCVQSGKCTPEQAAVINKSVYDGAAGIRQAKAAEAEAKKPTDWTKVVTVAAWAALGLGVLYAILKYVPAPSPRLAPARPL